MTTAPQVPRLSFSGIDDAIAALRERGLRLSTARRLVLDALFGAGGPVSAERLATDLTIDAASVYRNLETLERHGVVRHVHLGHGPGLYVLVSESEQEYLYCDRCGAVSAVATAELDPVRDRLRALSGYEVRFTHFAIVGLCAGCAAQNARSSRRPRAAEHQHTHTH